MPLSGQAEERDLREGQGWARTENRGTRIAIAIGSYALTGWALAD